MAAQYEDDGQIQHPPVITAMLKLMVEAEVEMINLLDRTQLTNFARTDRCPTHSDGRSFSDLLRVERIQMFMFDSHTAASDAFLIYCNEGFAAENLEFIRKVEKMKKFARHKTTYMKFIHLFKITYDTHVPPNSRRQVNISFDLVKRIENSYSNYFGEYDEHEIEDIAEEEIPEGRRRR